MNTEMNYLSPEERSKLAYKTGIKLGLDSEFRFKCRHCGHCCTHQDTIFLTPRDIYNIAKKQGRTMEEVMDDYTDVYVTSTSPLPKVNLLSNGPKNTCPLLDANGRCSVHDCKPTVCALFPLGRVINYRADGTVTYDDISYVLQNHTRGSAKRVNTVRSWLERHNIPVEDEFCLLWSELQYKWEQLLSLPSSRTFIKDREAFYISWVAQLYTGYDVSQEFLPQFKARSEHLYKAYKKPFAYIDKLLARIKAKGGA